MKSLPNLISISRLVVSVLLFFLYINPIWFIILYTFCGISDIADGYIARRLKVETNFGAKLDSLADVAMFVFITYVFIIQIDILKTGIIIMFAILFTAKLINLFITKAKFKQWGSIHTIGYKLIGIIVYIALPAYYFHPDTTQAVIYIICGYAIFATFEETAILVKSKKYNINHKSIFKE